MIYNSEVPNNGSQNSQSTSYSKIMAPDYFLVCSVTDSFVCSKLTEKPIYLPKNFVLSLNSHYYSGTDQDGGRLERKLWTALGG